MDWRSWVAADNVTGNTRVTRQDAEVMFLSASRPPASCANLGRWAIEAANLFTTAKGLNAVGKTD